MLSRELKADLDRRVLAAQELMRARDLGALVAVCAGAPQYNGWMRYFTNAEAWGGRVFVVVRPDAMARHIVMRSTYDAEWVRRQAVDTTVDSTLIQQAEPVARTTEIVGEITHGRGRIGMIRSADLTPPEHDALARALPAVEVVDVTDAMAAIREIKSPFEIEAIRETGRLQARALDRFSSRTRLGRSAAEAAGDVDGYLRGRGCFWGRITLSFDLRPSRLPAPHGRRFTRDDVVVLHLTHSGPQGYWSQTARVLSFRDLPKDSGRLLETAEQAMREAVKTAVPGGAYSAMRAAVDRVFNDGGFRVVGDYGAYCRSTGSDEDDGRAPQADDWVFNENMVLAIHPAPILEGGHGIRLAETILVRDGGGVSLIPSQRTLERIEAE